MPCLPRSLFLSVLLCALATSARAGQEQFHAGDVIPEYGKIAPVPDAAALPSTTRFKLAIDIVDGGESGAVNRKFVTAASFLNLQHANGIPTDNVDIALVVHGSAYRDLLRDEAYGGDNPNAELLAALQKYRVKVFYCGQSAAARDVSAADLLPGVELTHSATTTHVLLQQQGYALRP